MGKLRTFVCCCRAPSLHLPSTHEANITVNKTAVKFLTIVLLLVTHLGLTGCISYSELVAGPAGAAPLIQSAVIERQTVVVAQDSSAAEAPATAMVSPSGSGEYLVGPGDVLLINVDGKPELSSPGLASGSGSALAGSRVDRRGLIRLPMIGRTQVAGMTLTQIEDHLQQAFSRYLNQPWVIVEIAGYRSHPLYLLGQFKNAGTHYMDRPFDLLAGLALGGGMLDSANLRSARLIRANRTLPIDIYRLLREGALDANIQLQSGDTIFVPDDKNQNVFVFGAVGKPGAVMMPNGRLSLSQALASAGLAETRGRSEAVRIIRSLSPTQGELIVVDHDLILNGQALPFQLVEGDIVYIPRSTIGTWNQTLQDLLPSLHAVSALLQPFVSIKYLQED